MPNFSIDNLRHGIQQARKNIKTFEDAIDKENETIKQFKFMIETIEKKEDQKQGIVVDGNNDNSVPKD